jgi:hypothetical protein
MPNAEGSNTLAMTAICKKAITVVITEAEVVHFAPLIAIF